MIASNIQNFYKNKTVLLTGGTGFLGKVLIEKLLRTTEIKRIYMIIRPKGDKSIDQRIQELFKSPLFEKLCLVRSNAIQYMTAISGDCAETKLGLSANDRQELIDNVNIILHSAASVRFNEPLSYATQINIQSTIDLMDLAKEMKQLQSFVHVSSAFANCLVFHIEERYYTKFLNTTADELLKLKEEIGDDGLNNMQDELVNKFPNTYCYTKSIAEEAVLTHGVNLPICIFRPGIIIPTSSEPVAGWADNFNGPISIVYGGGMGVLRVMYGRPNAEAGLVPVDFCSNIILACAWHTATNHNQMSNGEPPIFNLVPDQQNTLQWGAYQRLIEEYGRKIPLTRMIWFPFLIFINTYWLYKLLCFIYHIVPGYIIDLILLSMGKKRRMITTYQKIHKQCDMLRYFVENEWTFDMTNTKHMWNLMTPSDKELFNFDMVAFDWSEYSINSLWGMRKYLAKEEPDTIPKARKLLKRLYYLNCAIHGLVYSILLWFCWVIFKKILI